MIEQLSYIRSTDDLKNMFITMIPNILGFTFIILIVGMLVYFNNGYHSLFWILIIISIMSIVAIFLYKLAINSFDIFAPISIFCMAYFFNHILKPIDYYLFGARIYTAESISTNVLALIASLIGFYSFHIGYFSKLGKVFIKSISVPYNNLSYKKVQFIFIFTFLIGAGSLIYIILKGGGFQIYLSNLNQRVFFFKGMGLFYAMSYFMPASAIALYSILMDNSSSMFFKMHVYLTLFLAFIGVALTGSRFNIIWLLFSIMLIRHYGFKRFKLKNITIVFVFILAFVIIAGIIRKPGDNLSNKFERGFDELTVSEHKVVNIFHMIAKQFYPHEELLILIDKMPDKLNFQYGKTYLNLAFHMIPSKVIPEKKEYKISMGKIYSTTFFPHMWKKGVTYSPGIIGEGYINFHFIGVIISMMIFGVICKCLYILLIDNPNNQGRLLVYAVCIPLIVRVVKGGLCSSMIQLLYIGVPLLITSCIINTFKLNIKKSHKNRHY